MFVQEQKLRFDLTNPAKPESLHAFRIMLSMRERRVNRRFTPFAPRESVRQLFSVPESNFRPIDGLRAFSILWVMLMHTVWFQTPFMTRDSAISLLDGSPGFIMAGHYGVDVFFVISGFLIGFILMREHQTRGTIDVKRFYARRFLRLMPAYFLSLMIYCLLIGVNCDMVWTNVLYVNNFISVNRQAMPWAWSLALEEQFYFTFPFFLLFVFYRLRRWRIGLLLFLLALGVLIRVWVVNRLGIQIPVSLALGANDHALVAWADGLYMKPYTRYGGLLCGVVAATVYLRGSTASFFERYRIVALAGLSLALAVIGFVAMMPAHVSSSRWTPLASTVFLSVDQYAIGVAVAYVLLFSLYPVGSPGRMITGFLSLKLWFPVAQLSYSAYLLHPIVLTRFYGLLASYGALSAPAQVFYFAGPMLSLLAASALYVFVEKPFMTLRDLRPAGARRLTPRWLSKKEES